MRKYQLINSELYFTYRQENINKYIRHVTQVIDKQISVNTFNILLQLYTDNQHFTMVNKQYFNMVCRFTKSPFQKSVLSSRLLQLHMNNSNVQTLRQHTVSSNRHFKQLYYPVLQLHLDNKYYINDLYNRQSINTQDPSNSVGYQTQSQLQGITRMLYKILARLLIAGNMQLIISI